MPATTPTLRATTSSAAVSGGSKLATALSLNACQHRAKSVLHCRPPVLFYGGDNYSDAGGGSCMQRPRRQAHHDRQLRHGRLKSRAPSKVTSLELRVCPQAYDRDRATIAVVRRMNNALQVDAECQM